MYKKNLSNYIYQIIILYKFIFLKISDLLTKKENLILILQMGKVGSNSIEKALLNSINIWKTSILRVHKIKDEDLKFFIEYINHPNLLKEEYKTTKKRIKEISFFRKNIKKFKKILIISGYREPVSFSISAFFQNIDYLIEDNRTLDSDLFFFKAEKIYKGFLNSVIENKGYKHPKFDRYKNIFTSCTSYYQDQLNDGLGLNIFEKKINKNQTTNTILFNKNRILFLYKFEYLNNISEKLTNFIQCSSLPVENDIKIKKLNSAAIKNYNKKYKLFIERIKFTKKELDFFYKNKQAQYLYSKDEISVFYKKWLSR